LDAIELFSAEALTPDLAVKVTDLARAHLSRAYGGTHEAKWLHALDQAIRDLLKRNQPWPQSLLALRANAAEASDASEALIETVCADDKKLASGITLLRREASDEDDAAPDDEEPTPDDDEEESLEDDDVEDESYDEDDDEAGEPGVIFSNDVQQIETAWLARAQRKLARMEAEQLRRSQPGYDRLTDLNEAFVIRYGAGIEAVRDVLVCIAMAQETREDRDLILVNGIVVADLHYDDNHLFEGDDRGRDAFIDAIADERTARKLGYPEGFTVEYASREYEAMPHYSPTPYHRCPCCAKPWSSAHRCQCHQGHLATRRVLDRTHFKVGDRCVYSSANDGDIPFEASLMARTRHGILFVSPRYATILLEGRVHRKYPASKQLVVRVENQQIHLEETLPPLPEPGTPLDEFVEVHSAERLEKATTIGLDAWWMHRYEHKSQKTHRLIAYATAFDVLTVRGTPRTEPSILKRTLQSDDSSGLVGAILGDRIRSEFGPRVSEILEHASKPKAVAYAESKGQDAQIQVILDGDTWKTVFAETDPIESFDDARLQEVVLHELASERRRWSQPCAQSIAFVTEHGVKAAFTIAENARFGEDDEDTDAVDYICTLLNHLHACPDCGVLEDCHSGPIPCGEKRASWHTTTAKNAGGFSNSQAVEDLQTALF
jgi:hypothetical protein